MATIKITDKMTGNIFQYENVSDYNVQSNPMVFMVETEVIIDGVLTPVAVERQFSKTDYTAEVIL